MLPASKINIRQRRSKTVGPGLKMGRTVPTNRLRDVNNAPKDIRRLGAGGVSRVNALRRVAGHFEKMVEVVANEVSLNSLENLAGKTIQFPPEKLELVNSIQARIIKESLDNGLGCKIPAIRELEPMINIGKKVIDMDARISDTMELGASLNKKAEELAIEERRTASDLKHLEGCMEAMDDFIREEINPVFAAIERKRELLVLADKKLAEIAAMFEGFSRFKF